MCELFAINSPFKIRANDFLREFFSHGTEHPHGWGMATFFGSGSNCGVSLEKEAAPAFKSEYLKQRLRFPLDADKLIAHIRLATKGSLDYENTHPFVLRDKTSRAWTLAHNGTIFDCDALNKYARVQQGATDSERILMYLIEQINHAADRKGSPLSDEERFSVAESVILKITPENKVNLLLYDGDLLYAHTNYKNSLCSTRIEDAIVISTRPLGLRQWTFFPMNTLTAFKDGKIKHKAAPHQNEFFDSEEKNRLLFIDYASL